MRFQLGRVGLFHLLLLLIDLPKIEGPHDDPFPTRTEHITLDVEVESLQKLISWQKLKQAAKAVWNNRGAIVEQVKPKPKPDHNSPHLPGLGKVPTP